MGFLGVSGGIFGGSRVGFLGSRVRGRGLVMGAWPDALQPISALPVPPLAHARCAVPSGGGGSVSGGRTGMDRDKPG